MLVLGVLLSSWVVFRIAGWLGVRALNSARDSGRSALAVMLLFTAASHFNHMRHDLARMVPHWMPQPMSIIYITGVLEVLGAIGLLIPQTRRAAGICLGLLMAAMFPGNIKAAQEQLTIGGQVATPLLLRIPMQLLFIALAWWSTSDPPPRQEPGKRAQA
jgi:uncharacterized membrane protein